MRALVGAHNQEKALVGAFSVIVKTDGSFAALHGGHQAAAALVTPANRRMGDLVSFTAGPSIIPPCCRGVPAHTQFYADNLPLVGAQSPQPTRHAGNVFVRVSAMFKRAAPRIARAHYPAAGGRLIT